MRKTSALIMIFTLLISLSSCGISIEIEKDPIESTIATQATTSETTIEPTAEATTAPTTVPETMEKETQPAKVAVSGPEVLASETLFIRDYQAILPIISGLLEQNIEIVYTTDNEGNAFWLHYLDGAKSTIKLHCNEAEKSLMISCGRDSDLGAMLACSASIMQLVSNLDGGFQESLEITRGKMLETLEDSGEVVSGVLIQGAVYDTEDMHYAFTMLGSKTMHVVVCPLT